MASDNNPYRAPRQVATSLRFVAADGRLAGKSLLFSWSIIFALNTIVPLFFGCMIAGNSGLIGMMAGVAVLFEIGWTACRFRPQLAHKVILGGVVLSLTQFFPVIQMFVGAFALVLVSSLGLQLLPAGGYLPEMLILFQLGIFLVTLLVGGVLLVFAVAIGFVLESIFNRLGSSAAARKSDVLDNVEV